MSTSPEELALDLSRASLQSQEQSENQLREKATAVLAAAATYLDDGYRRNDVLLETATKRVGHAIGWLTVEKTSSSSEPISSSNPMPRKPPPNVIAWGFSV
jgi:hypothetical protein